ncbi:MAG: transcription antitermination factor NusB [Chitinophagaceae bacterium]|jgi:N utilization substance protein B|nr:transcription antitermination factor NusB [Chitinophagaceae bacterium]
MISRRNIRVKVMQTIYTLSAQKKDYKQGEPVKILQKHFDQTRELLIYLVYFITEVASYAEKDAYQKASKHLPTEQDMNINTKIAGNELMWKMLEDESFKAWQLKTSPANKIDKDLVRKFYFQLVQLPEYNTYINRPERDRKEEKEILEIILNQLLLPSELFISHIEEHFTGWEDDADLVLQLLAGYMQKPGSIDFYEILSEDKWAFAKSLLETVLEKEDHLSSYINPKLKNWDADRIALLDMILMKMGVSEFLYFETIPPKVTINEYIDLAKEYSTEQSGHFINGILDNIHKEMVELGNMHKKDFKKA